MSTSDLIKFPGGTQDKGVSTFEPSIDAELSWDETTVNVTGGIRRGVGVRYGVAPLAGHNNTETPAGTATNGIYRSQLTTGSQGLIFREQIYGIVPVTMAPYDGAYPKANRQFYVYLVGLNNSGNNSIDACIGATLSSSVNKQEPTLVAGLAQSSYRQESPLVRLHKTELMNLPLTATPVAADMVSLLVQVSGRYWTPLAHISVSGKRVPYQWMIGEARSTPDATTAPNLNLWDMPVIAGTNPVILGGSPSEIITREFSANNQRLLTVYCLDSAGNPIDLFYTKQITQANTQSAPAYDQTTANYTTLTGATKGGASVAYSSAVSALINDPGSYTNTRHEAILVAGLTPYAVVYQDWLQAVKGMMPRWVDLTNPGCNPRLGLSRGSTTSSSVIFVSSFATIGEETLRQAEPDSGILRVGVAYDVGFSYYNKLIDYETNVVFGCTKTIGTSGGENDDFYALLIDHPSAAGSPSPWQNMQTDSNNTMPWEYSDANPKSDVEFGRGEHINDYELRFYYRENGTEEWLPAGSFDAAYYWFNNKWQYAGGGRAGPAICTGPAGNLIGGRPNGFQDYSPLPKQTYICTQVFQNRAFWWAEKSFQFSRLNNIYAYPAANIVAVPTGKWRGGIVHIRNGLDQQTSRLLIFGDSTYSARFNGERAVQNVRISADVVGQFEVDGSDFRMEYLCESTAYSYRSACVAEGVAYWWGPQGIYQDDGIAKPVKISGDLEPNIFKYVDLSRDSEVVCAYNKRTSEVVWFYPPRVADATYPTYLLIYNVENGQFYPGKMRCQVDSVQNIKIENDSTPSGVNGERILIHARETTAATVQRTFYFDDIVLAGEQGPARELSVISFSTPTTGQRRLVLAAGSIGVTAGGIAANDLISLQNVKGYAPALTLADDMIAKVMAVNNASSYIDILLPDGATFDSSATLTGQTAFPIYQKAPAAAGLHGITYRLSTNYWLPDGLSNSWWWQYLYFLFRYDEIPTPTDPFTGLPVGALITLGYRSLVCEATLSDILALKDNSSGHAQIHHPLRNIGRAASGQALSYSLSGIHIGDPWTLQYLEAHCLKEKGFTLKEFEG